MKVILLSINGAKPATPVRAEHLARSAYWRFEHGEEGRGRRLVLFPLSTRDFPGDSEVPDEDTEYRLVPVSEGRAHILVRGSTDGHQLVLWWLSPGDHGSANYSIAGNASLLAEGYEAYSTSGLKGSAPCPVVYVSGPCFLKWTRGGKLYGSPSVWCAEFDGQQWNVEPVSPDQEAIKHALAGAY